MAIDVNVYTKSQYRVGIAEEGAALGTPITTQSSFKELELLDVPQPDWSGRITETRKRNDGKRVLSNTDIYQILTGGVYTVQIPVLLTDLTADLLLYGVMQDLVSEAATTPYLKEFECDGSTTGDNSGVPYKLYTINGYDPATDESWQMTSCVLKTLQITGDPGSNGGRASAVATFWTGYVPVTTGLTVTPASWTAPGRDWYEFQLLNTKTLGGSDLVLGSFDFTWENNAERIGHDASGNPQQYHMSDFSFSGSIVAKYDANTKDAIQTFQLNPEDGSAETNIIVQWGDGTADGTLQFDINAIYSEPPNKDFGQSMGVMLNLPFIGVDDGTNEAVVVKIANAVDRAW